MLLYPLPPHPEQPTLQADRRLQAGALEIRLRVMRTTRPR
jgi:hypothetical protein